MDRHAIDVSVVRYVIPQLCYIASPNARGVSSANPWLDFLPAPDAHKLAEELNTDMEDYCSAGPSLAALPSAKRLYGFGLLPLVPGASADTLVSTVAQISKLPHLKGVIMGTRGLGKGLDDDALEPVWGALEEAGLVVFLHPHYGVDKDAWGTRDNGHVLPLALGFPFETTVVRYSSLYLSYNACL